MLKTLQRLLSRKPEQPHAGALQAWAQEHGYSFLNVRSASGCVIEGKQGALDWRIEWGQSQRSYIPGFELRLIADLQLPKELMAIVLNRALMESMERAVYEQYVDNLQTRIDTDTPPEMRWLVMHTKATGPELGNLRDGFGGACSAHGWLSQWVASPLRPALLNWVRRSAPDETLVLTIGRGRVTLRTGLPTADPERVALSFGVFEHAIREAQRLGAEWKQAANSGLTTLPSAWAHSAISQPQVETAK